MKLPGFLSAMVKEKFKWLRRAEQPEDREYWRMLYRVQRETIYGDERLDPISRYLGDGPRGERPTVTKERRLRLCLEMAMKWNATPEYVAHRIIVAERRSGIQE